MQLQLRLEESEAWLSLAGVSIDEIKPSVIRVLTMQVKHNGARWLST